MKFPIIAIKPNEAPLYYFEENTFGLVSKGGEKFYKNGTIYDSDGSKYQMSRILSITKASFLISIKYFQPMFKVNLEYTFQEKVELTDFKKIVIDHIFTYKRYWLSRNTPEVLKKEIEKLNSFEEVIRFLE